MARYRSDFHISMTPSEKFLGWVYWAAQLLVLPALLQFLNRQLKNPFSMAELNFAFYAINFLSVCLIFRTFLKKSLTHVFHGFWDFIQAAVLGYAAYWACSLVVSRLIYIIDPTFANVNDSAIASLAGSNFWLMAASVVILVPVAEECFYRGLVFRLLHSKSKAAAYILSVCVFAAIHIVGYLGSAKPLTLLLCFLQYLPAGLCLAWSYEKSDTIFTPILIHAVINGIAIYTLR